MPYLCHNVAEEHEVHGATILNVVLGRTFLLPIFGFGYPAVQDTHFCQVVGPYIGRMANVWNLFVEVNKTKDHAEKDKKSRESYEALWELVLRISKSDLAAKDIPEEPFRNHFYDCL